jgi:hypothetical protein
MTGKQARKLRKRAHIAAVIATQNAWIEDAFFVQAGNRRERDTLFAAAAKKGKQNGMA